MAGADVLVSAREPIPRSTSRLHVVMEGVINGKSSSPPGTSKYRSELLFCSITMAMAWDSAALLRRNQRQGLRIHRIVSSRHVRTAGRACLALDHVECTHAVQHTHITDLPRDAPARWKFDRRRRCSATHHTIPAIDIAALSRVHRC